MTTLYYFQDFRTTIDGQEKTGGSPITPAAEVEINDVELDSTKSVAVASTWDAWGFTTEEPVSAFEFLWIKSDLDGVQVELTVDKGGEVGTVVFAKELTAGVALVLVGDGALALHTADFATGTLDVIDRIRIRNPSSNSVAAKVRVFLAN